MALHVASSKGHAATVTMLIEAGANVHCKSNKGSGQYTALHAEGETETVKTLVKVGADVHCINDEGYVRSPL
jgi:ankyrin repeat protein